MLRVALIVLLLSLSSCVKRADRVAPKEADSNEAQMEEIYDQAHQSREDNQYRAIYLHKKNCDLGYSESCNRLGAIYLSDRFLKKDEVKAQYFFHRSCKLGNTMGCHNEGNMLRLIRRDFPSAIGVYKDNCHNNHYTSCFNLAMMYIQGRGVERNGRLAKKYFKKACEGDVIEGCKIFANMSKKQIRNARYK